MDKIVSLTKIRDSISNYYYRIGVKESNLQNEELKLLDSLILTNTMASEAFCQRGNLKVALEKYDEAKLDFDRAIEINPKFETAYKVRGNLKIKMENYLSAIEDFSVAININSNSGKIYFYRGIAKTFLKQIPNACIDFNKAAKLKYSEAFIFLKTCCNKKS